MEILKINATHGPNYWSISRHHLIVMLLDIKELEYQPTNELKGFYSRLKKLLPGLYEHRCSEGVPGGFFARVKRGTWMGHVVEHIALELQILAGMAVTFGQARGSGVEGRYQIVIEYQVEEAGRRAAELAVLICEHLIEGRSYLLESAVEELQELAAGAKKGPSTTAILEEARRRGIPYFSLNQYSMYQLGYGKKQKRFAATISSGTSHMAVDMACDKAACKEQLQAMAIPVPEGTVVSSVDELREAVRDLGFPLVIKPVDGNHGRKVTTNIIDWQQALEAYENALLISEEIIVERFITGKDYRLLVIDYKFVAAALRTPAHVVGDGIHSIRQLIEALNSDPRRGYGHEKVLTKLRIDHSSRLIMRQAGYTLSSILPQGEALALQYAANLSSGGTATDVTALVHPSIKRMAERVARIVQLDICGIDLMAADLQQNLSDSGAVVLEVNAAPGLRMHLAPSQGEAINVAVPLLEMLFPEPTQGRIPILAITGTNGKTTTTRLLAHLMQEAGRKVGYTTTDGIYINEDKVMGGDCTGPRSCEFVLRDPTIDTAVLECARGGLLRGGLSFEQCDVGIVTNVASDHLGIDGITSLEKMARLKGVLAETVKPDGFCVLNADDDLVYEMRNLTPGKVILFSMNATNERILAHRSEGGKSILINEGFVEIWDGQKCFRLEEVAQIPLSLNGSATFMIENIMAAVGAAYVSGLGLATIKRGLLSFYPSPEQTPGRMNRFSLGNFDVIVDYAHNPAGMLALKDFLDQSSYSYKVGILAAIGDRRLEDSLELGRLAADIFDEVIIREDHDLRGRMPGELTEILQSGMTASARRPRIKAIANEIEALSYAIEHAQANSVVILCTEDIKKVLSFMQAQVLSAAPPFATQPRAETRPVSPTAKSSEE